jgi:tripartite-type tricarboxylate transporter receptor subunit TctC
MKMSKTHVRAATAFALTLFAVSACSRPADSGSSTAVPAPGKWVGTMSIYIPTNPGGGFDIAARALQRPLADALGASVVPVNVPGVGGAIAAQEMFRLPADGTSMMITSRSVSALPYTGTPDIDPVVDFIPLGVTHQDVAVLTVRANAPYKTLEEFVDYARKNPRKLQIGHSGVGGVWHAAALLFARKIGTEFSFVPYAGGPQVGAALIAGEIDAMMIGAPETRPFVEGGGAVALAAFGKERSTLYPNVPTLVERGIDVTYSVWRGYVTNAKTPEPIAAELSRRLEAAAKTPSFLDAMTKAGFETTWIGPAEFRTLIEDEDRLIRELFAGEDFIVSKPKRG